MASTLRGGDKFDSKDINVSVATAWVNFNGTGTVSIRDQFNMSSITDTAVGRYNCNFITNLANANYSANLAYTNEANNQHAEGFLNGLFVDRVEVDHFDVTNSVNRVDKVLVCVTCWGGNA